MWYPAQRLHGCRTRVPFLFREGLCLLKKHRGMYRMEALPSSLPWLWGHSKALAKEFLLLKPLAELILYSYYLHLHFWGEMSTELWFWKMGIYTSANSWTLMTFSPYGSIYFIRNCIGYAWEIFLGQPLPWDLRICIKSTALETEQNGPSLPRS